MAMQKVFLVGRRFESRGEKNKKKMYLSFKRRLGTAPVQTNAITAGTTSSTRALIFKIQI
jgi:hypothetical protein|tara:strand:- start:440 stop:619 length:180 start_codon:yes stop_codon:yes gene_type:complete